MNTISCDKGILTIKGTANDIKAELSCLMRALVNEHNILTPEDLAECVEFANLTDKEIEEKTKKLMVETLFKELLLQTLKATMQNTKKEEDTEDDGV